MPTPRTAFATCMLCEASCGVKVTADGNTQLRIEGDDADGFSRGHVCPKVTGLDDVRTDPNRITRPMRRDRATGKWSPISWADAMALASDRLASTRAQHGPHAIAVYAGNPNVHSHGALLGGVLLTRALGSYSRFSATSVDQLPQMLVAHQLFGNQLMMPVPDLERTRFLLVLGANPAVSNGSLMTAPDVKRRLKDLRARGGKLVVIDPRRTETAELADEHHFIVPGTDALLLLAMLQVVFSEQRTRKSAAVANWTQLEKEVAAFTPDAVASTVGIDAETIRRLARAFASTPGATTYPRLGACTQVFGGLTAYLAVALDAVTGNLDAVGGKMFTTPAIDLVALGVRLGLAGSYGRFKSRVRGLPEFGGELPVAVLAEEIATPGKGQIRALVTAAGNPVLSAPNGPAVDAALGQLDFMVSIDLYLNETTRHADLILPTTFGLERPHYDLALATYAIRNVAKYAAPVFAPPGETRDDFEVMTELGLRVAERRGSRSHAWTIRAARALGTRRILDLLLRLGPQRTSLAKLEANPHGVDFGPLQPRLKTPIDLDAKLFLDELPRARQRLGAEKASLQLIGRRGLRSNNSWMHNVDRLTKGPNACTALMHPDDAKARGLEHGAMVKVTSRTGSVRVQLEVTDGISRGVVSIPHGWGHHREGTKLDVAAARAGVSLNDLTDERLIDPLTATAAFSGVPVDVARAD